MNIFKTKNKGFTIIELIVVIAIIAVLSAIVVTNVTAYQKKTRNSKRLSDIKNYTTALEMVYDVSTAYPDSVSYRCLGDGYPDETCWVGYSYREYQSLEDALRPYIALPISIYPIMAGSSNFRGYLYYGSATGKSYSIYWFLEGASQSCGFGTVLDQNWGGYGITYCNYSRSF